MTSASKRQRPVGQVRRSPLPICSPVDTPLLPTSRAVVEGRYHTGLADVVQIVGQKGAAGE